MEGKECTKMVDFLFVFMLFSLSLGDNEISLFINGNKIYGTLWARSHVCALESYWQNGICIARSLHLGVLCGVQPLFLLQRNQRNKPLCTEDVDFCSTFWQILAILSVEPYCEHNKQERLFCAFNYTPMSGQHRTIINNHWHLLCEITSCSNLPFLEYLKMSSIKDILVRTDINSNPEVLVILSVVAIICVHRRGKQRS